MKEKTAFYRRFFVTLLLAALIPQGVAGTTYRWVDENGNPVLSDRPPPAGTPYTEVDSSSGFGRPPQSASQNQDEVSSPIPNNGRPVPQSASTYPTADDGDHAPERQPAVCEQAKTNILKLETLPRIRVEGASGEVRFMTEDERTAQLDIAYRARNLHCDED